ncbi:MAG: fasciclin domain-containing protein [Microscillaceae bacterium]|nr:fasciclin domain-containing protein [Microscillaceae bacterium]
MKNLFFALSLLALSLLFVNCGGGGDATDKQDSTTVDSSEATETNEAPEEAEEAKNIVGLAQETEALSTLVKALQAADLVSALEGEGPFTVFAPTNEAFAALGETLDDLLKPENKEKLAGILKYHVVSGLVKSTDLTDGQKAATLNGAEVTISTKDGVSLNGKAKVTTADVEASNGVVHIIDAVILPPGK